MAANRPFLTCALLIIVMVLAFETIISEGRTLMEDKARVCRKCLVENDSAKGMMEGPIVPPAVDGKNTTSVDTQDSRPTTPGHSPGVGH